MDLASLATPMRSGKRNVSRGANAPRFDTCDFYVIIYSDCFRIFFAVLENFGEPCKYLVKNIFSLKHWIS